MSRQPFTAPDFYATSFNCPFCNAYAKQSWLEARARDGTGRTHDNVNRTDFCFCSHCREYSVWHNSKMIYPYESSIEPANQDLEPEIREDYEEAASILQQSPRGAAALLRLALQKLCLQLGEKGENLNTDISNLTNKGLSSTIQQALDALRVIGNESVHPGQIDLRDDPQTAKALFKLLNKIAETMITEPKEIQEIYNKIPESKKEAIEKRDKVSRKKDSGE